MNLDDIVARRIADAYRVRALQARTGKAHISPTRLYGRPSYGWQGKDGDKFLNRSTIRELTVAVLIDERLNK